ncbi:MAG: ABC transporter ATPase, partial [Flavobacteriales bacterium]
MLTDFNNLPEDARIWIYASETSLNSNQQKEIINILSDHLEGWNAHKVPLTAGVTILENHFIVVALDENKNGASGCSIDTLQQKVQEIEKEFSISLMNRLNVFCKIEQEIHSVP